MRRAALVVAVVAAALAASATTAAQEHGGHGGAEAEEPAAAVSIGFAAFMPGAVDVLRGDSVRWTNASLRAHTVTAADGSWDSGRLALSDVFVRRFDAPGEIPYHCTLHAGMGGTVRVHDLLLGAPASPGSPGRAYPLRGRAALPAGTRVTIRGDAAQGPRDAGAATVGPDGTFAATVVPSTTTTYTAVAGDAASPPVRLLVLDHTVTATLRRRGRRVVVDAAVSPARPGGDVVLQLQLPERFGWWPVRHRRLDEASRVRFALALRRPVRARVLLTLPDRATPLAQSATLRVPPLPRGRRGR